MHPSEPFPHFVDDYLGYLQEVLPTQASLDGVHLHDDLLEDLGRPAIDAHIRTLSGFSRRLRQIEGCYLVRDSYPPPEQIVTALDGCQDVVELVRHPIDDQAERL